MSDRPYQTQAIDFAKARPGSYLALEQGLGKTRCALRYLANLPGPRLIIAPKITRGVWADELKSLYGEPLICLEGSKPLVGKITEGDQWWFCHYDIVEAHWQYLRPKSVALDECHTIRNRRSRRTVFTQNMISSATHRVALSGTPIVNGLMDLWPQLHAICPGEFGGWFEFGVKFCDGQQDENGFWKFKGISNEEFLRSRLSDIMLVKRKSEVLKDLPPLTRQTIEIPLDESALSWYRECEDEIRDDISLAMGEGQRALGADAIRRITKYLKRTSIVKAKAGISWLQDLVQGTDKTIIWTWFRETAEWLGRELSRGGYQAYVLTGEYSQRNREATGKLFEESTRGVLVATIGSAGVGLSFPSARAVAFIDLWWQPTALLQAEARAHRMTSQHGVSVYYLTALGTMDEVLWVALSRKCEAMQVMGLDNNPLGGVVEHRDELDGVLEMLRR